MLFSSWMRALNRPARQRHVATHRSVGFRLQIESLEDRWVPSTLTVINTNDSGAGSLRAAIAAANSGDSITFDSSLAGQSILIPGGQLAINKSLTIEGTAGLGNRETIGGNSFSRVFNITGVVHVTLDNLGIGGGLDAEGAGIYNNGGTLTINDSSISGNSTNSPNYNGGGIYNVGGTVIINRSTLVNNDAEFHYLAGGGNGGGIYNAGGTVTIIDSTLYGNDAYYSGGGIYNNGGAVTIRNSSVINNYDYYGGAGIYNMAGGTVIVEYSSNITGNLVISAGEDVSNGSLVYLDGTSTIGILHGNPAIPFDPNALHLRIGDATITEGNTGTVAAHFTIALSAASTQTVDVAYATANGTATSGSDYQATNGTLTFAPGEVSKTVTVLANGDRLGESTETFTVNLSNPTNASIEDGQGIGTIIDDEPHISISDVTKSEGNKNKTILFTFTVSLSVAYDQPVTMSFQTVNGTAKASDKDFVAKAGTITFAPGETTKTITITVNGDSKKESDEVFYLDLFGNSSNSFFTKNRGIGTILNDD